MEPAWVTEFEDQDNSSPYGTGRIRTHVSAQGVSFRFARMTPVGPIISRLDANSVQQTGLSCTSREGCLKVSIRRHHLRSLESAFFFQYEPHGAHMAIKEKHFTMYLSLAAFSGIVNQESPGERIYLHQGKAERRSQEFLGMMVTDFPRRYPTTSLICCLMKTSLNTIWSLMTKLRLSWFS